MKGKTIELLRVISLLRPNSVKASAGAVWKEAPGVQVSQS